MLEIFLLCFLAVANAQVTLYGPRLDNGAAAPTASYYFSEQVMPIDPVPSEGPTSYRIIGEYEIPDSLQATGTDLISTTVTGTFAADDSTYSFYRDSPGQELRQLCSEISPGQTRCRLEVGTQGVVLTTEVPWEPVSTIRPTATLLPDSSTPDEDSAAQHMAVGSALVASSMLFYLLV